MAVSDRTTGTGESVARWGRQSQSVGHRRIGWLKPWSCAIYMLLNGGVESGVGVVKVINVTSTGECGGSGVYRHPSRPLCLVIDGLWCCCWNPSTAGWSCEWALDWMDGCVSMHFYWYYRSRGYSQWGLDCDTNWEWQNIIMITLTWETINSIYTRSGHDEYEVDEGINRGCREMIYKRLNGCWIRICWFNWVLLVPGGGI